MFADIFFKKVSVWVYYIVYLFIFVLVLMFFIAMIKPCTVIFGCLALGEAVVWLLGVPFPGSIVGMLLLTALLKMRVVELGWVKPAADFLVANLGFFFIPPGVALMLYFDVLEAELWPIVIATVVSTVLVLLVTGWTHQFFINGKGSGDGDSAE